MNFWSKHVPDLVHVLQTNNHRPDSDLDAPNGSNQRRTRECGDVHVGVQPDGNLDSTNDDTDSQGSKKTRRHYTLSKLAKGLGRTGRQRIHHRNPTQILLQAIHQNERTTNRTQNTTHDNSPQEFTNGTRSQVRETVKSRTKKTQQLVRLRFAHNNDRLWSNNVDHQQS